MSGWALFFVILGAGRAVSWLFYLVDVIDRG